MNLNRFKNYSKFDFAIVVAASLMFVVLCYFLLREPDLQSESFQPTSAVGFLKPKGSDVRLRSENEMSWSNIYRDNNVYENDRVFTGNSSTAEIQLDQSKLLLEPNSLIVIQTQKNQVQMGLGSIFATIQAGKKLIVEHDGTKTEIESAGANIRIEKNDQKKIKIVVVKGEIILKAKPSEPNEPLKQDVVVQKDSVVFVEQEMIEKFVSEISLKAPLFEDLIWSDSGQILFSWVASSVNSKSKYRLELSQTRDFQKIEKFLETNSLGASLDIPRSGFWFWRVRDLESSAPIESTTISAFQVYPKLPPQVSQQVAEIQLSSENSMVSFQWNDPSLSSEYELLISHDPDQRNVVKTETLKDLSYQTEAWSPGTYFWSVTSKHPQRSDLKSLVSELHILPPKRLPAVSEGVLDTPSSKVVAEILTPQKDYQLEIISAETKDSPKAIHFERVDKVQVSYVAKYVDEVKVRVSEFENFKDVYIEETVSNGEWVWEKPAFGQYYVYFFGTSDGREVRSETVKVRTVTTAPLFRKIDLRSLADKAPVIHAAIVPNLKSHGSEIQMSRNREFKEAKSFKTQLKEINLEITEPGVYFLRTRALNSIYWPISRFSEIQEIDVKDWHSKRIIASLPIIEKKKSELSIKSFPEPSQKLVQEIVMPEPDFTRLHKKLSLWGGLGFNFVQMQQQSSEGVQTGTFARVVSPTTMFGVGFGLKRNHYLLAEYHNWPGKVTTSINGVRSDYEYNWKSLSFELQSRIWEKNRYRADLLTGVQIQEVPFINLNSSDQIEFLQTQIQKAFVGGKLSYLNQSGYEFEGYFRISYPYLSKGSNGDFILSNPVAYDGSLGLSKSTRSGFRYGVYWFGQAQKWSFETKNSTGTINGTQDFFNSNVQVRIGQDFFGLTMLLPPFFRRRRKTKKQ